MPLTNARKSTRRVCVLSFASLLCISLSASLLAEEIYVDARHGKDSQPGSKAAPVRTLTRAANLVNSSTNPGPTVIKIAPGLYTLEDRVLFQNLRPYTEANRLLITATVLPDDPEWKPAMMPVIVSTQERGVPDQDNERGTTMYGLQIEISHVTIQGLKFLGNPAPHNRYYPIRRNGRHLDDLVVTQCLFVGDRHALPIHLAIIANGHGLVVDHCVFYNCKNAVVFWNAQEGDSHGNAMRYCIVDGGYRTGVWVTGTAEDFDFHNNVVTRCEYFFVRGPNNTKRYRLRNSVVTEYKFYSGYGNAGGPMGETSPAILYDEENIVKKGKVVLEIDTARPAELSIDIPRNYLHVVPGTPGSDLGAGLFRKPAGPKSAER